MIKNLILSVNSQNLKTLFIKRIVSNYKYWLGGITTCEMRNGSRRDGYEIITMEGERVPLASVKIVSGISFNKYAVNIGALEDTALKAIKSAQDENKIVLIDEIGSISLLSDKFVNRIRDILSSKTPVLLIIRSGAKTFSNTLSVMSGTEIHGMEKDNYHEVEKMVDKWFEFWIRDDRRV